MKDIKETEVKQGDVVICSGRFLRERVVIRVTPKTCQVVDLDYLQRYSMHDLAHDPKHRFLSDRKVTGQVYIVPDASTNSTP